MRATIHLFDDPANLTEVFGIVSDNQGIFQGMAIAAGVSNGAAGEPNCGGLGDGRQGVSAENRRDHLQGDCRWRVIEPKDLGGGLALFLFDLLQLIHGVDEDEVTLFAVGKAVGMQNGVEGFTKGYVIEVGGNLTADALGGKNVLMCLDGERAQQIDEVGVADVKLNGAFVTDAELALGQIVSATLRSGRSGRRKRVPILYLDSLGCYHRRRGIRYTVTQIVSDALGCRWRGRGKRVHFLRRGSRRGCFLCRKHLDNTDGTYRGQQSSHRFGPIAHSDSLKCKTQTSRVVTKKLSQTR